MKNDRFTNPLIHYGILAVIYGIGLATILFHTVGHAAADKAPSPCANLGQTHVLQITTKGFNPKQLEMKRCDQVQFVAADGHNHELAFGTHNHHLGYPGYTEHLLKSGTGETITLSKTGSYLIHDHLNDTLKALVTIK